MICHRYVRHSFGTLLLGVFAICVLSVVAQENDDGSTVSGEETGPSEGFEILSEAEVQAYRQQQLQKLQEELNSSSLSSEHKDLIALALSKSMVGTPISSYVQETFSDSHDSEPNEEVEKMTILETGLVENEEERSYSLDGSNTPFPHIAFIPLDPASGQILTENDSEIVFRFEVDIDVPEQEDMPQFIANIFDDLQLVVDLKIDTDTQSMQTTTLHLLEPIRKLFLFKFHTFKVVYEYEFVEDCDCMAVTEMNIDMGGSAILVGRFFATATVAYSEIECEKPLRYIHLNDKSEDVFTLMF